MKATATPKPRRSRSQSGEKNAEIRSKHISSGDERFTAVVSFFANDQTVEPGSMFGSSGLKVAGKVFAMAVKGDLVVKLPAGRVEVLVAEPGTTLFDPGHGRLMKEWIATSVGTAKDWINLAVEAKAFVSNLSKKGTGK